MRAGSLLYLVGLGIAMVGAVAAWTWGISRPPLPDETATRWVDWTTILGGASLVAASGLAMLALAYRRLWRWSATALAAHFVIQPAGWHLGTARLADFEWPRTVEVAGLILLGQAVWLAVPWLAGHHWRWAGAVTLLGLGFRIAGHSLHWNATRPEVSTIVWDLSAMLAILVFAVCCLSRMRGMWRHVALLAGTSVGWMHFSYLGWPEFPDWEPAYQIHLVAYAAAGVVFVLAWLTPRMQALATPFPEPGRN